MIEHCFLLQRVLLPNLKSPTQLSSPESYTLGDMGANSTASSDAFHSYSSARAVMGRIKNEHDAPGFPSQWIAGYDPRIHSAAHVAAYGEGGRTGYVQIPGYYDLSQVPISASLSRKGQRADTSNSLVTMPQYTLEESPLDYSNISGAMPSEGSDGDSPRQRSSRSRNKKRKIQKRKKESVPPEYYSPLQTTLSQVAAARGSAEAFYETAKRLVSRPTEERLDEERTPQGNPKRPMNAFMIYRKTYQGIANELRSVNNNHQQISKLCGESWHLESAVFRKEFKRLAKTDSLYHSIAFPGYKYAPSKNKKGGDELVEGRGSTKTGRVTRSRKKAPKRKELQDLSEEVLLQAIDEQQPLQAKAVHHVPYWTSVAVQTYPAPYAEDHDVYPDPTLYETHITTFGDGYSTSRISPPVAHGLYEDTEGPGTNYTGVCIDPSLLPYQSGMLYNFTNCSVAIQQQPQPAPIERSRTEIGMPSWDRKESPDAYLKGTEQDWEIKELGEPSHFDDWMAQTQSEV
ncbi:hypothetical protein GGI35DRAFT_402971 [Trichoderma velutinum]